MLANIVKDATGKAYGVLLTAEDPEDAQILKQMKETGVQPTQYWEELENPALVLVLATESMDTGTGGYIG